MPIISELSVDHGLIRCWRTDEPIEELALLCKNSGISIERTAHLDARHKQLMVTALLHAGLFPGTLLNYEATGKPVISNGDHVSISHSGDYLVMMKSTLACGIDIEKIHPRVRKVRHKFLNDDELASTEKASDETLTRYWTAKEAMFKVSGSDRIFMRSNIFVTGPTPNEATAVLKDGPIEIKRKIRFHTDADMILAWTEPCNEA